ncbi:hypothetical protein F6X56_01400 (plasmid) [Rhodococcus erythropolis]|uniref:hypothetical protein n=1 Tax=Rhodococcus TaxID=1827 RepID=UPI0012447A25|nr:MULTISPECIES: hypothetical protein [Rhodococcus]MCJ0949913.1 hypothetical protein [Rhodococcus sp. ARC_M8]QEX08428.1 hypothetical protein F6X56_01400 [Rhodococcus erythropolis]
MSTFVDGLPSELTQRAGQVIASDATISDIKRCPATLGSAPDSQSTAVSTSSDSRFGSHHPASSAEETPTSFGRFRCSLPAKTVVSSIANLVWSTDDPVWFGTDAIVQEFLTGGPLHMYDRAAGVSPIDDDTGAVRPARHRRPRPCDCRLGEPASDPSMSLPRGCR